MNHARVEARLAAVARRLLKGFSSGGGDESVSGGCQGRRRRVGEKSVVEASTRGSWIGGGVDLETSSQATRQGQQRRKSRAASALNRSSSKKISFFFALTHQTPAAAAADRNSSPRTGNTLKIFPRTRKTGTSLSPGPATRAHRSDCGQAHFKV